MKNREIKFRGKRLTDGKWIYGDFFRNRGKAFIIDLLPREEADAPQRQLEEGKVG